MADKEKSLSPSQTSYNLPKAACKASTPSLGVLWAQHSLREVPHKKEAFQYHRTSFSVALCGGLLSLRALKWSVNID